MSFHIDLHQVASIQTEIKTFDDFKVVNLRFRDHSEKELGIMSLFEGKGSIPEMLPIIDLDCRTPKKEETQTP